MSREDRRILGTWGPYSVRRFRAEHAARIQQRGHDVKASTPKTRFVGFTLFKGAEIVACGGVRHLWQGVGEGWVLTSPLVHECPRLFTVLALRGLEWLHRTKGYHRIGAHVLVGFNAAEKWANRLGFHREGPADGYGPNGEDFIHYGRVWR